MDAKFCCAVEKMDLPGLHRVPGWVLGISTGICHSCYSYDENVCLTPLFHSVSLQPITEARFLSACPLPTVKPLSSSPQSGCPMGVPQKRLPQTAKAAWFCLLGPGSSHQLLIKSKLCAPLSLVGPPASLVSTISQPTPVRCLQPWLWLLPGHVTFSPWALHQSTTQSPVHKSTLCTVGPEVFGD